MPRSLLALVTNRFRNVRYNYLFLPGLIALALAALAAVLTRIDRAGGDDGVLALFPAGPNAAGAVLATIATAVATVAGVAFSITIVSLQLVSQQFTPRALRGFLGDRLNQTIAGVLIGVFLYCLVALRSVEEGENSFLPGLTMSVAVGLAFVALALLLVFVHHMGHSIQVSEITRRIAEATLTALESPYPSTYGQPVEDEHPDELVARWEQASTATVVHPEEAGFVQSVNDLPHTLGGRSFRIELLVTPGEFVTARHPLARLWTDGDPEACATAVRRGIAIGAERDLPQDVGYGVRQLTDIAVKALSPSVNDPTTATTCIGYLQAIVEQVAARPLPATIRRFPDQDVTIVMPHDAFSDYLAALTQISRYATADARAVDALLHATLRIAQAASDEPRRRATADVAVRIARRALDSDSLDEEERERIAQILDEFRGPSAPAR